MKWPINAAEVSLFRGCRPIKQTNKMQPISDLKVKVERFCFDLWLGNNGLDIIFDIGIRIKVFELVCSG